MKRITAIAALALLTTAEPALSQTSAPETLYEQAVQDRLAGRNPAAISGLRQVLALRPEDVDARLNLGLALLAEGRLEEADAAFAAVLRQAPDYIDAHIGRARVAQRRGDLAGAGAALDAAEAVAPGSDPNIAAVRAALASGRPSQWRWDARYAHSELSAGLDPWSEVAVSVSRRLDDRRAVAGLVERTERFGHVDVFAEARYDQRIGRGAAYIAVGGAPDADYRPEISLKSGGQAPLGGSGLAATLDASAARYRSGTVTTLQPGLEQAALDGRLVIRARWINVWDETDAYRSGYALGAVWAASPSVRLRGGYADAPESSDGVTVEVRSISMGVEIDISDRTSLRLTGVHEERTAYDRDELGVGLGWRF